ncbi:MAG: hypothetical protein DSY80_06900, partial [Desulfocapsa sp.]
GAAAGEGVVMGRGMMIFIVAALVVRARGMANRVQMAVNTQGVVAGMMRVTVVMVAIGGKQVLLVVAGFTHHKPMAAQAAQPGKPSRQTAIR